MLKKFKDWLNWILFHSDWSRIQIDKMIVVMYIIPIVLLLCHTITRV